MYSKNQEKNKIFINKEFNSCISSHHNENTVFDYKLN